MSALVSAVTPIEVTSVVEQPTAGSTIAVTSGTTFAITDPETAEEPVTINTSTDDTVNLALGTESTDVIISGTGTGDVVIGIAESGGNTLGAGGSALQVTDDFEGSVTANLTGAIISDTKVDTSIESPDGGTIASNAPSDVGQLDYYVKGGAGDDQLQGSQGVDFIRGGAGDDTINAAGGDDIIRFGSGDDTATLGDGDDTVYFTVDQLQGVSTNTITDFDSSGNDKIQIDSALEGRVDISGQGTDTIIISLSGSETGTTTVESTGGETIDEDDIEFI